MENKSEVARLLAHPHIGMSLTCSPQEKSCSLFAAFTT
jgi:hypothetical protein